MMQDNAGQGPIKKASIHSMTARCDSAVFAPICTIIEGSIQQLGATEVEISSRCGVWCDGALAGLHYIRARGGLLRRAGQSIALPLRAARNDVRGAGARVWLSLRGVRASEARLWREWTQSGRLPLSGEIASLRGRAALCPSARNDMTCSVVIARARSARSNPLLKRMGNLAGNDSLAVMCRNQGWQRSFPCSRGIASPRGAEHRSAPTRGSQ